MQDFFSKMVSKTGSKTFKKIFRKKFTVERNLLYEISICGKIQDVAEMGTRLMAGQQTLNLYVEVRLLCPQPEHIERTVMKSDGSFVLNL